MINGKDTTHLTEALDFNSDGTAKSVRIFTIMKLK